MRQEKVRGLMEVARETGIPYYRIIYAEHAGHLPEPGRIAFKRVYGDKDVERIKAYFARKGVK
jgi:hypothetical protein